MVEHSLQDKEIRLTECACPNSSNVNEVIRGSFKLFFFFYKKISHAPKHQKHQKHKKHKDA